MKISDLSYETEFFWKGNKYTQVIRPKKSKGNYLIICRKSRNPFSNWIKMPAGRKVIPFVTYNAINNN